MLTSAITSSANLLLEVEGRALQQHPQQLVRVPGEAVRPRHALEPPQPRRAGHQQAAAPRSLHADTGNTGRGAELVLQTKAIRRVVIKEKAPIRAFSCLKVHTSTLFTILLRHYAKQLLTHGW